MTSERCTIEYGQHQIDFTVVRRHRTTLEIAVEPDMAVVVAAPLDAPLDAIVEKVRKRAAWVRRQQRYFTQFMPRTPERLFEPGETHLYLGRQYRLKVEPHIQAAVKLSRGYIHVQSHTPHRPDVTRQQVLCWYRERARIKFAERLSVSLDRFADPVRHRPSALMIRQLRHRWGSMSPNRRLMLNLQLIQAPIDTIDYVITHELCHVTEPHHRRSFFELLESVMPDWQRRKERLERAMT
jgi:predicted metal-dependent hydrolase